MSRAVLPLCLLLLSLVLAACDSGAPPATAAAESAPVATPLPDPDGTAPRTGTTAPAGEAPGATNPLADATPGASAGDPPLDDAEAERLLESLLSTDRQQVQAATDRILAAGDQRFVAAFLELLRAGQIGLGVGSDEYYALALERLSGETYGRNWFDWVEWYGGTSLEPPPGFTAWKGQLLARIDRDFAPFFAGGWPARLRVEEIQWGGVRVDGIPALDEPQALPAAEAAYLQPGEPVFGIALNGEARAYPLRIMDWHEMANDTVGGVPVSLAYCTLCGAAIAFDGRASNGRTYTFGSSGLLYRSNKLMYDRQTRTLWNQLTGEPVLGPLVGADLRLTLLPVVLTTWEQWQIQHPDTMVLDILTGYDRVYEPGAAYADYFAYDDTMFPVWQRSERLPPKTQIYALLIDGRPKAYPLETLTAAGVVNDELAGTPLALVARGEVVSVTGYSLRRGEQAGPQIYPAGAEIRAYDRGEHRFSPGPEPDTVLDQDGWQWQVTEEALVAPDGRRAPRVNGHLAYWFGWFAFFPQTALYE